MIYRLAILLILVAGGKTQAQQVPVQNQTVSDAAENQVDEIDRNLNLEDRINLISGEPGMQAPGLLKFNLPALKMTDGPNGPHFGQAAPGFPVGICLAATWDTALMYRAAAAMGACTLAQGRNMLLGPCINIQRVPTGGRNFESYGEDPWLTSRMAVAFVKGLQSQHVIATVKHFALNNNEWNRHLSDVRVQERALREIYLPAFEAAVKEGGALAIMSSYNKIRGVHASENEYLLKEILRKEWAFKGLVVSDWASVYSTPGAINGGLDIEMPYPVFLARDSILKYLQSGSITQEAIDTMARHTIYARIKAGLVMPGSSDPDTTVFHARGTNDLIRNLAANGIVLLKNKDGLLPITREHLRSIAVIGPNAAVLRSGGGGSSYIDPFYTISPLDGIRHKLATGTILRYAPGDSLEYHEISAIPPDCYLQPDGHTPGLRIEYYDTKDLSGEPAFVTTAGTVDFSCDHSSPSPHTGRNNYSIRWSGFLAPRISGWYILKYRTRNAGIVYIDSMPAIDRMGRMDATPLDMRIYMEAGRKYSLKVETFVDQGIGQSILGWISPERRPTDRTLIDQAVYAAKDADLAVVCLGWDKDFETEGYDKEEGLSLPGHQEELIQAVAAANPNTVVILNSGTPVWMDNWASKVKGIIMAFYPGQEGGNALADILFGDMNPSGKLPFTFARDSAQAPAFANYMNVNPIIDYKEGIYLGYRYIDKHDLRPQYPFGFGLSYTTFSLSGARVTRMSGNNFRVDVRVTSTGKRAGQEVVQLYVGQLHSRVDRPIKELKAFGKLTLQPGEQQILTLALNDRSFAYYDPQKHAWVIEPGKYRLMLGNSSQDIQQAIDIDLSKYKSL